MAMPVKALKDRFESCHSHNMLKGEKTKKELEDRRSCLYADLYQTCTKLSVRAMEELCRRIHSVEIKIHSFKGGLYAGK